MTTHVNTSLRAKALKKLEESDKLPSMPQIVMRVREVSENPKSSPADLANIILSDHTLTTRILRVANSAYYGQFSGKVSTVTQAIVLMGFNAVRNAVLSVAIYDTFARLEKKAQFNQLVFWAKSLGCGVVAKEISQHLGHKCTEEAFIAGFMHDIGQPIVCSIFADDIPRIGQLICRTDDPVRHEREQLGIDHQEVGAWLAKKWNLPQILISPIKYHHRVGRSPMEKSPEPMVDIVYAGDQIINRLFDATEPNEAIVDALESDLHRLIGISRQGLEQVIECTVEKTQDIAGELNIEIAQFAESTVTKTTTVTQLSDSDQDYAWTRHRLDEAERELAIFREAASALRAASSEGEILQTLLEGVYRGLGLRRVLLLTIDRAKHLARGVIGFGVPSQQRVKELVVRLKPGVGGLVNCVADNRPLNILDVDADIYSSTLDPEEITLFEARAFCLLPVSLDNTVEYVIFIENGDGEPVEDDKLRSVESLVIQASLAIERHRLRRMVDGQPPANDLDSLITVAFEQ